MLTYQLQHRVLRLNGKTAISFPNDVEINVLFKPSTQFGNPLKVGKTIKKGSNANLIFDANTGRTWVHSDLSLKEIDTKVVWNNLTLHLKGNLLTVRQHCNSREDLQNLLETSHFTLPLLLNIELIEAPLIQNTKGKVGNVEFNWEIDQRSSSFDVTDDEFQEKKALNSFLKIENLNSRRLIAAAYYSYVARRLAETGNSIFEFMAETILNLCKVLQVLFGERIDDVRCELAKLGYSKKEIESNFIPIMVLRNEFDVGHVFLSIFNQKQLITLYRFLESSENNFSDLLKRVFEKTDKSEYSIKPDPISHLEGKKLKIINRLLENIENK
ncbi:MAG: hypothetical protein ACM3UY_01935 [Methanocella sp.]